MRDELVIIIRSIVSFVFSVVGHEECIIGDGTARFNNYALKMEQMMMMNIHKTRQEKMKTK